MFEGFCYEKLLFDDELVIRQMLILFLFRLMLMYFHGDYKLCYFIFRSQTANQGDVLYNFLHTVFKCGSKEKFVVVSHT